MMRVTFVIAAADLSGGCRVVAAHAENLMKRGHQVLVLAREVKRPSFSQKLQSLMEGRGWPGSRAVPPSHLDGTPVPVASLEYGRPVTEDLFPDADVVVATWWETAEWVKRLPRSKGEKVYFLQHYEADLGQPAGRVDSTWRLPFHKITCCRWMAELARDRFGQADVTVVPNGVDHKVFYAGTRAKQPVPTVGVMYALHRSKGCDVSLKAFELAARERPRLRLVVLASIPISPELPLPPNSKPEFLPTQSRIRELYASCDAWLFGSRSEGFGLPVLEAMACGTPVIGTRAGIGDELIDDRTGIPVEFDDHRGMADAIIKVHDASEEQWAEWSAASRRIAEEYTWERASAGFEAALNRAIGATPSGSVACGKPDAD